MKKYILATVLTLAAVAGTALASRAPQENAPSYTTITYRGTSNAAGDELLVGPCDDDSTYTCIEAWAGINDEIAVVLLWRVPHAEAAFLFVGKTKVD